MSNIPEVAPESDPIVRRKTARFTGEPDYLRCGASLTIQQTPCRCVEPEDHSGQHRVTYGGLAIVWATTWVVSER